MSIYRQSLVKTVARWQQEADRDQTDNFKYNDFLDDLLYQADMRFSDYKQYPEDGPFTYRLKKWIDNLYDDNEKKAMFRMLRWLVFVDNKQMQSLYRDAYRSKVVPWIENKMKKNDLLAIDYQHTLLRFLREYYFCSVTESFNVSFFKQVNSLGGLPKMDVLGEHKRIVRERIKEMIANKKKKGIVLFEDMVGTGNQAVSVLREIKKVSPTKWRILFVPLIIMNSGLKRLRDEKITGIEIEPVLVVKENACVQPEAQAEEPPEFKYSRSLVKKTAPKVVIKLHPYDDVPKDAFGYEKSGALVVTSHNTPNNTLPLIHHRAPFWYPLFRRVHHKKDE